MPKTREKNPPEKNPIINRGLKEYTVYDEVWDGMSSGEFTKAEFILFILIDSYGPKGCYVSKRHLAQALHINPRSLQEIIQKNVRLGNLVEWYKKVPYQEGKVTRYLKTAWIEKYETE